MTTPSPLGPLATPEPHTVLFGRVDGENRGENPMDPPIAWQDDLFWLRDDTRKSEKVLEHLRAENAFTQERTASIKPLSEKINGEHIAYLKETDTSVKTARDSFLYYHRTVQGLSYKIHCREPIGDATTEEVLIDVNKIAEGKAHCDITTPEPSPSHKRFAYAGDFTGDEIYDIFITTPGRAVDDPLEVLKETDGDATWGLGDDTLFYVVKDDVKRSYKVFLHVSGTPQAEDVCLFTENDELFSVGVGKTRQGLHVVIGSSSTETSERYVVDLVALQREIDTWRGTSSAPEARAVAVKRLLLLVRQREKGVRYWVDMHESTSLFILTNANGCFNHKVVLSTLARPDDWSNVVVAHSDARMIAEIDVFERFMTLSGREDGLTQCWKIHISPGTVGALTRLSWPEPIYSVDLGATYDYASTKARIVYSSLTTPQTWIDIDMTTDARTVVKQREILGYNPQEFVGERLQAVAADGTKIDISVVRRADVDMTKPHPTMLYGYGSYGICMDPDFQAAILPYLTRGVVYCIAHIRGGGENGRLWYERDGKYLTKRNTFSDFVSCAEHIIAKGITTPSQLAIEGRSAGGLLMGVVVNLRPDLFKVVIAGVPFTDVMVTMCDASIPLTTGEWEEWGNPNEDKYFSYMKSYSPMDNIVVGRRLPSILIVAGLHDPRVAYWEPAKWATRLRRAQLPLAESTKALGEILVKMDLEAGHFSASDRYRYLREKAFEQAYVLSKILPGQ